MLKEADYGTTPTLGIAHGSLPGHSIETGGTRVDVITSCLRSRIETSYPVRHSQWVEPTPMSNCVHSRAHPLTLVHARLLDIRWTPYAELC